MFKLSKLALIGALSVTFVSCGSVAHANPSDHAYVSVNKLLRLYVSDSKTDNATAAVYVAGVHDAFAGLMVCSPNNVGLVDVQKILLDGLLSAAEKNIELLHMSAGFVLGQAMIKMWPCAPKGKNV